MHILSVLRNTLVSGVGLLLIISLNSCGTTRNMIYLEGQFDTAKLSQLNATEPLIRKGDLLSIIVFSDNPEATRIYNQSWITTNNSSIGTSTSSQTFGATTPAAPGYQVDVRGDIIFQGLGRLHVEGLTKDQLKDTLDSRLKPYLLNPYYNIRFLNYKFTVLGEVTRPGAISIPGERINLLEALAIAGDMTFYGRRDNVLVIRENNGKREFARLDIRKPEVMSSPYFYLQQNDVVIIEPNKKKSIASDQATSRSLTIAASVISMAALLYSIFRNN